MRRKLLVTTYLLKTYKNNTDQQFNSQNYIVNSIVIQSNRTLLANIFSLDGFEIKNMYLHQTLINFSNPIFIQIPLNSNETLMVILII